jgi:hypothetical protein
MSGIEVAYKIKEMEKGININSLYVEIQFDSVKNHQGQLSPRPLLRPQKDAFQYNTRDQNGNLIAGDRL